MKDKYYEEGQKVLKDIAEAKKFHRSAPDPFSTLCPMCGEQMKFVEELPELLDPDKRIERCAMCGHEKIVNILDGEIV